MRLALKVDGINASKNCKIVDVKSGDWIEGIHDITWSQSVGGLPIVTVVFTSMQVDINHDSAFGDK